MCLWHETHCVCYIFRTTLQYIYLFTERLKTSSVRLQSRASNGRAIGAWFQASAALFWDLTQRRLVVSYRYFTATPRSLLQRSSSPWYMIWYMVWCDLIWYDILWYDVICYDMIRYDMLCYAMIWFDMIRYDMLCYDLIWYDMLWYDLIRYDMLWYDMICYDMLCYDMIWYDTIWYDMLCYDMIWYDTIRYDMLCYAMIRFDVIYLLTEIGLTPGSRSIVHIYAQTIRRTIQNNT
jgi:hypothetical protein